MRLAVFLLALPLAGADYTNLLRTAAVRFEENRGQMPAGVRFAARGLGYSFLFFDDVTVLRAGGRTVRLTLEGGAATPFAGQMERAPMNYFRGPARVAAPAYARLRRIEAYPGIDLVYYGAGDRLEFDFVVRPGADPSRIRMRFRGAERARLNGDGDLVLAAGLVQKRPHVYQADGRVIESRYVLGRDGAVGVELGARDKSQTLVVDPVLVYSVYLAGGAEDAATHVAVDAQGFVYVAGATRSTDFPMFGDAYQPAPGAFNDIIVLKLNPALPPADVVVYGTYLGGAAIDELRAMAVDAAGNVYLTGRTNSLNFPTSSGAAQTELKGDADAFVLKLDTNRGKDGLVFSTLLGGGAIDFGQGIAVDSAGMIYVAGGTQSLDFPVKGAAVQTGQGGGGYDAFVTRIDPSKTGQDAIVASTYLGGESYDSARGIAAGEAGKVYVTGITYSIAWPRSGERYQPDYRGLGDAFVAQIDFNTGNLDYSTHFGSGEYDEGRQVTFDPQGRIIVSGFTLSAGLPVAGNALQGDYAGGGDVFVAIFDPGLPADEQLLFSTFFGGNDGDMPTDLRRDAAGRLYLTGYTLSRNFPVSADAMQGASANGGVDGFVAVIDPVAGTLRYSSYLTSAGFQVANSVALAGDGTMWVVGSTTGKVVDGRTTAVGNPDALVLAIRP